MANITFGTTAGNWNVAANWVGGVQPGTGDTAVFTATSASCTIPAATTVACGAVDCSGLGASNYTATLTFAATTSVLTVGSATLGSVTFVATMTLLLTGIGTINFVATTTGFALTTGGLTLPNVTFNGIGGGWTIEDSLNSTITSLVTLGDGALQFGSSTCVIGLFKTIGSVVGQTLSLGSASITLTGTGTVFFIATGTRLTVPSSTATITASGSTASVSNAVPFLGASLVMNGTGVRTLPSPGTWVNVTFMGSAVKTDAVLLGGALTITGTFTATGSSTVNRLLVESNSVGTQITITAAAVSLTNVDFMDINGAGAATWSGTSLGDCQGNSGITFDSPVSQTWSGNTTGTWSTAANWTSRVPLPQDNVAVNALTSGTITVDMPRMGANIDFTGSTGGTFTGNSHGFTATSYGNVVLNAAVTYPLSQGNGISGWALSGRSLNTITTNGVLWPGSLQIANPGGTYSLGGALTCNADFNCGTNAANGTFDNSIGNYTVTAGNAATQGRLLLQSGVNKLGSATYVNGGTSTTFVQATAASIQGANATFVRSLPTTVSAVAALGGATVGSVIYNVANSPGALTLTGANTFVNAFTIGSGRQVIFPASTTTTFAPTCAITLTGQNNGYWYVPGVGADYASTPDAAPLDITGDITLDAKISLPSWTAPTSLVNLIAKFGNNNATNCYFFDITTSGTVVFHMGVGGTSTVAATSNAALSFSANSINWVRATRQQSSGTVQFYTSPDGVTWTQLGTNQTLNAGTAINNTSQIVEFGSYASGIGVSAPFSYYEARIYPAYQGTGSPVFDANFTTKPFGANSFTESSTNAATVTINGILAQCGDGRIMVNSSTNGTQATLFKQAGSVSVNYLSIQDSKATGIVWYAGTNSTNVSNNSGWVFGTPSTPGGFFGLFD